MAKPVRSSRRKSSGKRSPSTQELRLYKTGTKGSSDGFFGVSATPTAKPGFKRNAPRVKSGRDSNLTESDLQALPSDAQVGIDGARQAKLALYSREPQPREPRVPFRESHDVPSYDGFKYDA